MASLLIVDDELSMRQFLTHLFQREGHSIRVAENGRRAMELLRQQPVGAESFRLPPYRPIAVRTPLSTTTSRGSFITRLLFTCRGRR